MATKTEKAKELHAAGEVKMDSFLTRLVSKPFTLVAVLVALVLAGWKVIELIF